MFPIDVFRETLCKAIEVFQSLEIRFHLTGGIATVAYGEPRMTQDVDLVIDNKAVAEQLELFLEALSRTDFLFDEAAVRTAVEKKQMFQLLDRQEALKLDVYPRELIPGELQRSVMLEVFEGMHVPAASRPDVAASKLVWISKGSHKSRRDLRQIVRLANEPEREAIRELARQLGLERLLDETLAETDEPIE